MATVALVRCDSYDIDAVRQAVRRGLDLLGGAGAFAPRGKKVLLKPNLLVAEVPDKCVTTHPSAFRAVAEIFREAGAILSYGDSPSIGSTAGAAKKAGLTTVARELGITEADFKTPEEVFFEAGRQNKKFTIARAVRENDMIISLPKLKTHAFEKYTGCIKNQFGCVPGMRKGEYHIKLPDAFQFAQMLVDLNNLVKPALYVMDGIMAMEGNGPRGGRPRPMKALLFSADPVALDATVCRMLELDPSLVPTVVLGHESGAGVYASGAITLLGDDLGEFREPAFLIDRKPLAAYRTHGIMRFASNRLVPKPFIVKEKCIACGQCVQMCPTTPKSVDWTGDDRTVPPAHNYATCIRCYCCQEICPESAIELKKPMIRRLFGG